MAKQNIQKTKCISQGIYKECLQKFCCESDGNGGLVTSGPQVGGLYKSRF